MNVLFIFSDSLEDSLFTRDPKKPLFTQMDIQTGISYISSVLKQNGHSTDLFVATQHTADQDLETAVRRFKPGLICFTAVFREFPTITRIARRIKKTFPNTFLIAGGPYVTLNPETAIQENFDAVCIGEGEYPVLELTEQLEQGIIPENIENLWIKKAGGIIRNPARPFIQDLDRLPFPDRDMWQKWIKSNTYHKILLGRGCPFSCTYCCNHALKKVSGGKYVRFRSPEKITAEIRDLIQKFPDIHHLYLEVEAMNLNLQFLRDFCNHLEAFNKTIDQRITYGTNYRIIPSQDVRSIFELMHRANINEINIGLESGNERIRKEMMRRDYSNQDVIRTVKTAKEFGFSIMLYVMVGIPTETKGEFQDTIALTQTCKPDIVQLSIFCPYPGTDLFDYCRKYRLIEGEVQDKGRDVASMDLPGFSKKQIQELYYNFTRSYGPVSIQYIKKRKK